MVAINKNFVEVLYGEEAKKKIIDLHFLIGKSKMFFTIVQQLLTLSLRQRGAINNFCTIVQSFPSTISSHWI